MAAFVEARLDLYVVRIHQELEGMMHFRKNKKERPDQVGGSNADGLSGAALNQATSELSSETPAPEMATIVADLEGENSSLTAEEAEEIRAAFQQVLAMESAPESAAPLSMDDALALAIEPIDPIHSIDPLDLRDYDSQIDLIDSFAPEAVAASAATVDSSDTEIDTLTDDTPATLRPTALAQEEPELEPICLGFQESVQVVEQIALAVDEADLLDTATPTVDVVAMVEQHLEAGDPDSESSAIAHADIEPSEQLATVDWREAIDAALDDAIAVDAVVDNESISLIDSISLVDMGLEAEEVTVTPTDAPLTYFQYYLEEDDEPADAQSQTTWRQPSVPAGLIGAGVLGATLISGFMIADSLKQPTTTQAKKPQDPSPLQSLNPQEGSLAMATPKPTAPETMRPEVPLPPAPVTKPEMMPIAAMPPVLPPLPALAEPIVTARSLDSGSALDTTTNNAALGEGKFSKSVAPPETIPLPPTPQIAPVATSVSATGGTPVGTPLGTPTPVVSVPAPGVSNPVNLSGNVGTAPNPTLATPPDMALGQPAPANQATGPVFEAVASAGNPLPKLEPGVAGTAADLQTVVRSTASSTESATVAGPQPIFVPVEAVAPGTVALPPGPQEIMTKMPPEPTAVTATPTELIYRQELPAQVAPVVPTAVPQQQPPTASVDPALQSLLTAPGFSATVTSLRSLTQAEAVALAQASQLGAFSRQSLGSKEYVQAYRSVSQQLNVLPPFGFIDYRRQMILLPVDIAATLQQGGQFTQPQMAQANGMAAANLLELPQF